mmetsp:Transcript_34243/g.63855  ORF Transcript_34243/g.63855 Transcript_34243/m.63855 type:complete len:647 (-) Transcript_34243:171-2111(-)
MAEENAKQILIEELKNLGGSAVINSLSVRVKWGQENLKLGRLRDFIESSPEVFQITGNEVHLVSSPPPFATTGKAAPGKGAPASIPPFTTKAGSKALPMKRPFEDTSRDGQAVSKARYDAYGDDAHDGGKGGKDNGKSDKGCFKGASKAGKGYGKNSGGDDSLGLTGVSKAAPDDQPPGLKGSPKGGWKSKGADDPGDAMSSTTFVPKGAAMAKREMAPKHASLTAKSKAPTPSSKASGAPPGGVQPVWMEDQLPDAELSKVVTKCKINGIDLELASLAKHIAPSSPYSRNAQRCVALLRAASGKMGMKPVVDPCGSVNQQTELDGSDIDLALRLPPGIPPDERDACIKELRDRLYEMPALLDVHGTMAVYPHTVAPLSVELKGATPRTIAHVLFATPDANGSGTVDDAIKQLCDTFELSRDLIRLIKLWAFQMGMTSHQKGYMNGMAWTVLTLCFLQQKRLVPSLQGSQVPPPSEEPMLPVLLREFFQFLASRGRDAMRGYSLVRAEEYPAPSGFLFLEDPVEHSRNLADSIGESQWTRILQEAQRLADKIGSRGHRWFHWAEVFDPRDVDPKATPKLPPLGQMAAEAKANMTPELAKSLAPSKGGGAPPPQSVPPKGGGKGPGPYQTGPPPSKGKGPAGGKGKW